MLHSTITQKGQTTIPSEIRALLGIKAGDVLAYAVDNNKKVTLQVHGGAAALKGVLSSNKGRGKSFKKIRAEAARNALRSGRYQP